MVRTTSVIALFGLAGSAFAGDVDLPFLLEIDLSVANRVTINATPGLSAVSISGPDNVGVYLDNAVDGSVLIDDTLVSGDLTSANDASDATPDLFNGFGDGSGLNLFSYTTTANSSFAQGALAFTGSATWDVSPEAFASFASPGTSGLIYFPADEDADLNGATVLGVWLIVPSPGAGTLLAASGLLAFRHRRF